ncbi:MAG: hypothetical protein AAFX50_13770 [Acidobacteriota bacterium]
MINARFFRHRPTVLFAAAAVAAALALPSFVIAGDGGSHRGAHVVVKGETGTETFTVDGDDLDVGENRQFFTEDGREVVVLRTESGFDVSIDGEDVLNGDSDVHVSDFDKGNTQIRVIGSGGESDMNIKLVRVDGGSNLEIDNEDGRRMVFVSTDDRRGDHGSDGGSKMVWVRSDDSYAFTLGDSKTALEHLEAAGVLDKLDAETREKLVEAVEEITEGAQNP